MVILTSLFINFDKIHLIKMSELNAEIVGKIVQGYKILKPLGQGKFSTVYQAQRQSDQKLVALKIVKVN
jgi:serine/threonine protein kinase